MENGSMFANQFPHWERIKKRTEGDVSPASFAVSQSTHRACGSASFWKDYGTCSGCGSYISIIRGEERRCPVCRRLLAPTSSTERGTRERSR